MHYVYIIRSELGRLYYGATRNLRRRLVEHNTGRSKSTSGHQWKLVYYEAYTDERDAWIREQRLKNVGQALAQLKRRISHSLSKS